MLVAFVNRGNTTFSGSVEFTVQNEQENVPDAVPKIC